MATNVTLVVSVFSNMPDIESLARRAKDPETASVIVQTWTPSLEIYKKVLTHLLPRIAEIKQMADMSPRVGKKWRSY
jgi:hypothetical protein